MMDNNDNVVTHEQQGIQMKKKKCRGNRKKQRYRRQLYNQGLDSVAVEKLVKEKFPSETQQQHDDDETLEESDVQNIEAYIPLNRVCSFKIIVSLK